MKVYTHFYEDKSNDIIYRWRTLLQIGESWDICGTVFMKNPGSSFTKRKESPIEETDLLDNLRKFDDDESSKTSPWYEFSEDNTMTYVEKLFETYYRTHQKTLKGIIQIFNLFNIRDADLKKAIEKSKGNVKENLVYTIDDDIKHIVSPVYIGWGDLWKSHRSNADKIFRKVIEISENNSSYLYNDIQANQFYHPQFLMNYGKNRIESQLLLSRFTNDGNIQGEYDDKLFLLISIQRKINSKGTIKKDTINRIVNGNTLTYEYWCKGKKEYKKNNGTISIGLKINDDNNYVLSIISNGNHPDEFEKMICDYCEKNKWSKSSNDLSYTVGISTSEDVIVDFMTSLLEKMKTYRETDLKDKIII
jgi:hypothetical protein